MNDKTMHFSLPPAEYLALKILAAIRETNLRALVRDLVRRELAATAELRQNARVTQ